ncbi:hypothetical protein [Mycetocola sp.]|uniref:hypothetical protein n=1 Tax=Mycetocola sp. TaxID=1871042 RepID=UPI003988D602
MDHARLGGFCPGEGRVWQRLIGRRERDVGLHISCVLASSLGGGATGSGSSSSDSDARGDLARDSRIAAVTT